MSLTFPSAVWHHRRGVFLPLLANVCEDFGIGDGLVDRREMYLVEWPAGGDVKVTPPADPEQLESTIRAIVQQQFQTRADFLTWMRTMAHSRGVWYADSPDDLIGLPAEVSFVCIRFAGKVELPAVETCEQILAPGASRLTCPSLRFCRQISAPLAKSIELPAYLPPWPLCPATRARIGIAPGEQALAHEKIFTGA